MYIFLIQAYHHHIGDFSLLLYLTLIIVHFIKLRYRWVLIRHVNVIEFCHVQ